MKKILIFGGTGFIGLNLVRYLLGKDDEYAISLACRDNISSSREKLAAFLKTKNLPKKIQIFSVDVTSAKNVDNLVKNNDVIINLSGFSGAATSLHHANNVIETNTIGHLNILEAARKSGNHPLVILASSRLEYGKPLKLPVKEDHPLNPNSIYGISKYIAMKYSTMYFRLYGVKTITFRISNPFGPQLLPTSGAYNMINHFIHLARVNDRIPIFGDGQQKRDYIYVDDLCRAIELSFNNERLYGKAVNLGSGKKISIISMVRLILKTINKGSVKFLPWPKEWKKIETGDFYYSEKEIFEKLCFKAEVTPAEGIKKTIKFLDSLI